MLRLPGGLFGLEGGGLVGAENPADLVGSLCWHPLAEALVPYEGVGGEAEVLELLTAVGTFLLAVAENVDIHILGLR